MHYEMNVVYLGVKVNRVIVTVSHFPKLQRLISPVVPFSR